MQSCIPRAALHETPEAAEADRVEALQWLGRHLAWEDLLGSLAGPASTPKATPRRPARPRAA